MLGILLPTSMAFVFRAARILVARLVISGILFSVYMGFVLRATVVTKPLTLGTIFSITLFFVP